jgi:hypothetical protein
VRACLFGRKSGAKKLSDGAMRGHGPAVCEATSAVIRLKLASMLPRGHGFVDVWQWLVTKLQDAALLRLSRAETAFRKPDSPSLTVYGRSISISMRITALL